MHKAGFVHGDLRKPNILPVRVDESVRLQVIDFDFGGKLGEAVYPPFLNVQDIIWADGVGSGELVTVGHDEYFLAQLFEKYPATPQMQSEPSKKRHRSSSGENDGDNSGRIKRTRVE